MSKMLLLKVRSSKQQHWHSLLNTESQALSQSEESAPISVSDQAGQYPALAWLGPRAVLRERPEVGGAGPPGRLDGRQQTALFVTLLFPRRQLTGVEGERSRHERRGVGTRLAQLQRRDCPLPAPASAPQISGPGEQMSCQRGSPSRDPLLPGAQRGRRRPEGWPASCWLPRALA